MAWDFNSADTDYVTIGEGDSAWDIPDSDWAIGIWLNISNDSGTQYIMDYGDSGGSNYLKLYIIGGELLASTKVSASFVIAVSSGWSPPGSFKFYLFGRSGNTLYLYEDTTLLGSDDGTGLWEAWTADGAQSFGTQRNHSGSPWDGQMAEIAKWDRFPNSTERTGLAGGKSAAFYKSNLKVYCKALSGVYIEGINDLTVTNHGTTGATHPTIQYPSTPQYYAAIHGAL